VKTTPRLLTTVALFGCSLLAPARAGAQEAVVSFFNLSTFYADTDDAHFYVGVFPFVDGNNYAGIYDARDPSNCKAWFMIRENQFMVDGLTGDSRIQMAGGNDLVTMITSSFRIGGGVSASCRNLPEIKPLNFNGFSLSMYGGEGADHFNGSEEQEYMNGQGGNDTLNAAGWPADFMEGKGGNDILYGGPGRGDLSGGDGNDLVWLVSNQAAGFGGNGRDCLLIDYTTLSSLGPRPHCGNDPDSYFFNRSVPSGTFSSCETPVSRSVCEHWVQ
jgi:Ca2+-binding RTX toxin-like protein